MADNPKIELQDAVDMAGWTHNVNVNVSGFTPMQLVTGKNVLLPAIVQGNLKGVNLGKSGSLCNVCIV